MPVDFFKKKHQMETRNLMQALSKQTSYKHFKLDLIIDISNIEFTYIL
jgi:hypothetical protein